MGILWLLVEKRGGAHGTVLQGVKMHQVLIVEDDNEQAEYVQRLIALHPRSGDLAVERVSGPDEFEQYLASRSCDILLTDIRFGPGEPDGIELVRRHFPFGSRTQVIYVTGYVEYCTSVYRTDHVYFLTKPVSQCDLHDALDKALARLETVSDFALGVRSGGVLLSLPVSQIVFVESDRRKIRIHTTDKGVVETYAALRSLRERLPRMFIQCHQSFLVNAEYVSEFREKSLLLRTGDVVPVSQKKRRTAREAFFTYLREGA